MLCILSTLMLGQAAGLALPPVFDKSARHATVRIYNPVKDTGAAGIVIGRSGPTVYVLTAAHVVDKTDRVEVHVFDPEQPLARARVFQDVPIAARTSAQVEDLALLRITVADNVFPPPLALWKKAPPLAKTLSGACSVGCSEGARPTLLTETILDAPVVRKAGSEASARFWKCQKAPAQGRSGGPLLHADGTLLGVCSGESGKAGYYTHIEEIRRFLKSNGLGFLTE